MEKLSKEHVQFIEDYLISIGIKYWDVRIELIDHIVSKIEESPILNFEQKVTEVTNELGYKSYTIQKRLNEKTKELGKQYNRMYFKQIKLFFKSIQNIFFVGLFLLIFFFVYKELPYDIFVKIGLLFFLLPLLFQIIITVKRFKSIKKSIHLNRASFYLNAPFLFFNVFFYFSNNPVVKAQIFLVVIPIYLILSYCGYVVYKQVSTTYFKIYKELFAK